MSLPAHFFSLLFDDIRFSQVGWRMECLVYVKSVLDNNIVDTMLIASMAVLSCLPTGISEDCKIQLWRW